VSSVVLGAAAAKPLPAVRASARDQKEFTRMVAEKQSTFFESWAAMASQAGQHSWLWRCPPGRVG
jgi:hypothetical protein